MITPRCIGGSCPNTESCQRFDQFPNPLHNADFVLPPYNAETGLCAQQFPQPDEPTPV